MKKQVPTLKDALAYKIPENYIFMLFGLFGNIITSLILKYFNLL